MHPAPVDQKAMRARLGAELSQLRALAPPDVTSDLTATLAQLDALRTRREHLVAGTGPYQSTPIGRIARQLHDLDVDLDHARRQHAAARPWERRRWHRHIGALENYRAATLDEWDQHTQPAAHRIDTAIDRTTRRVDQLHAEDRSNKRWHREHPEHAARVRQLEEALADLDQAPAPPGTDPRDRSSNDTAIGAELDPVAR